MSDKKLHEAAMCEIESKDRKYRLKTYKNCFLGKDLVKWLAVNVTDDDLDAALEYGRMWQQEKKYFQHVNCDHLLKNENLFYRWQQRRKISRASSVLSGLELSSSEDPRELNWLEFNGIQSLIKVLDPAVLLFNMLESETAIERKNRTEAGKSHPDSWIGSEAVSWMEDKLLLTRLEAVQIGDWIMHMGYFRHVSDARNFFDDHFCYTTTHSFKSYHGAPKSLIFNRKLADIMHNNKSSSHNIYLRTTQEETQEDIGFQQISFNGAFTKSHIPPLVNFCIAELIKEENIQTEGIFRLSAQVAIIERLQILIGCCIDGGLTVLSALRGEKLVILYSQLLKIFLTELDDCLFSQKEQEIWLHWDDMEYVATPKPIQANFSPTRKRASICGLLLDPIENQDEEICKQCSNILLLAIKSVEDGRINKIRKILFQLPSMTVTLLWKLFDLLYRISQVPSVKMDAKGLARLFTPILFRVESNNVEEYLKHTAIITDFLAFIIENQAEIFSVAPKPSIQGIGKNRASAVLQRRSLSGSLSRSQTVVSVNKRSSSIQFE